MAVFEPHQATPGWIQDQQLHTKVTPIAAAAFWSNITLCTGVFYLYYYDTRLYPLMWFIAYAFTLAWALIGPFKGPFPTHGVALLIGIGLIAVGSSAWSYRPATSFIYSNMLVMNALFAALLAYKLRLRLARIMMTVAFNCFVLGSLVLLVFGKSYQLQGYGGDATLSFYGVFAHKSLAGYYFAYAFLLNLAAARSSEGKRLTALLMCVAAAACLVASRSRAGLGLAVAGGLFLVAESWLKPLAFRLVCLGVIAAMTIVLIFAPFVSAVIESGGSSVIDLSGRQYIWSTGVSMAWRGLPTGVGYAGFFGDESGAPSWDLWRLSRYYYAPHFHNSFLEMWVEVGWFAVVIVITIVVTLTRLTWFAAYFRRTERGFVVATWLFVLIPSIVDFHMMKYNSLGSIAMFYLVALGAAPARSCGLRSSSVDGVP